MKLNWGALALSLQWSLTTAKSRSEVGHVYLYNPQGSLEAQPKDQKPLLLESAQLIIAERLGLSRYYSLGQLSKAAIQQMNELSGLSSRTLDALKESEPEHALVIIEGIKDPEKFWPKNHEGWARFELSDIPSASENRHFLDGLHESLQQVESSEPETKDRAMESNQLAENLHFWKENEGELLVSSGSITLRHIQTLQNYMNDPKGTYTSMNENLILHIERLTRVAKSKGFPLTVLLMPPSSVKEKRSAGLWGNAGRLLRRQQPEQVLSSAETSSARTSTADGSVPTGPVRGILPSCFETESSCTSTTHGCSGHGKCVLKRKKEESDSGDCWGCVCESDTIRHGSKTVFYGGPACQKKDVVTPFWLLAGSTIGLFTIISAGIGLLYSMGSEELPSVIGAGVSGPRPK